MELILLLFSAKYNFLLIVLFVTFILSIIFLGSVFSVLSRPSQLTHVEIVKGDTLYQNINKLNLNSYDQFVVKVFFSIFSSKQIYPGIYDASDMSLQQFFKAILSGELKKFKLQIIEGDNVFNIASKIQKLLPNNDCPDLGCLDNASFPFVEGTLFPDTYFLTSTDSVRDMLINSQLRLSKLLDGYWNVSESRLDSKYQALILASLIEKEAGTKAEMPVIASVFYNRIKIGMKLQSDPTIIYGLLPNFDGDIKKTDIIDKNNIFNTYAIKGLPPTPISMVSKLSLDAVFNPANTDFYYFVSKGNGEHYFSKTLDEHQAAVRKFQLQ
ncbi:MAG: endolytic transglycosylase MltG [Gammaproteobacteria bacterium]